MLSRSVGLVPILALVLPAPAAVIYQARNPTPGTIFVIAEPDETSSFMEIPAAPGDREAQARVGDRITFAGTDRFVTGFSTRIQAFAGTVRGLTIDVQLNIYEPDASGLPGALLWSGVTAGISLASATPVEVPFAPNMTLPNTVCFAIAFPAVAAAPGEARTFGINSSPVTTVGASPVTTFYQLNDGGPWTINDLSTVAGGVFRHVDARVEAIPGPGGAAMLSCVTVWVRRPQRRVARVSPHGEPGGLIAESSADPSRARLTTDRITS